MVSSKRPRSESGEGTVPGDSDTGSVVYSETERRLLVQRANGGKEFQITVPAGCRITFGPWSPGTSDKYATDKALAGTLRIYQGKSKATENIIAVFSGVVGFRDVTMGYAEKIAVQEGTAMWKSDQDGYVEERKEKGTSKWVPVGAPQIESGETDDVGF